jgi:hypothetical protein
LTNRLVYSFPSCILALTLFRCHLCLLSHSLCSNSSFPTFWAALQPQLLITLTSYFRFVFQSSNCHCPLHFPQLSIPVL